MGLRVGVLVFLFSISCLAAEKCESLIKDLKAMQSAQKQLLDSFARKNDMMAIVLEENAEQLESKMIYHRSLKRTDLKSLRMSAQAFRGHDIKEQALVSRFEMTSSRLLDQVSACLSRSQN